VGADVPLINKLFKILGGEPKLVLLAVVIISSLFFVAPLALGIFLLVLSSISSSKNGVLVGIALVVFSFFLINLNKVVVNDLIWYSEHYFLNLTDYYYEVFGGYRAGVQARWTEPFYHSLSYVISNLTSANYTVFVFMVTVGIYGGGLYSVNRFIRLSGLNSRKAAIVLIFFLFFGVVFTQSLHLIRQYLACMFILVSLVGLVRGRVNCFFLFAALAFLTHNATFIVSILFYSIYFLVRNDREIKINFLYCFGVSFTLAAAYIVSFFILGSESRLMVDDGSIGTIVKITDASLFVLSLFVFIRHKEIRLIDRYVFFMYFSFCVFLFVLHFSGFLGLRYYFYLDFLRWIPVYMIFLCVPFDFKFDISVSIGMVFLGVFYTAARMERSPFVYGAGFFEYLFYPLNIF